jgi:hypothetical protein
MDDNKNPQDTGKTDNEADIRFSLNQGETPGYDDVHCETIKSF